MNEKIERDEKVIRISREIMALIENKDKVPDFEKEKRRLFKEKELIQKSEVKEKQFMREENQSLDEGFDYGRPVQKEPMD